MGIKREHKSNTKEQPARIIKMAAILKNVTSLAPRALLEDALGLAAISVIIIAGFCLPALT